MFLSKSCHQSFGAMMVSIGGGGQIVTNLMRSWRLLYLEELPGTVPVIRDCGSKCALYSLDFEIAG
jgi:hypothetical protein